MKAEKVVKLLALSLLLGNFGCVNQQSTSRQEVLYSRPAAPNHAVVPEGVVRYCWEEPMVRYEKQGPGLDTQGHWYHPAYVAVREVRMGKWRPCDAPPDGN